MCRRRSSASAGRGVVHPRACGVARRQRAVQQPHVARAVQRRLSRTAQARRVGHLVQRNAERRAAPVARARAVIRRAAQGALGPAREHACACACPHIAHDRQLHRARCQHCCEPRLAQRRPRGQANVESPSSAVLQQTRSAKHDRREREAAACVAQKESRKSAFKFWHCFKTIVVHDFEHDHEDVVVPQ